MSFAKQTFLQRGVLEEVWQAFVTGTSLHARWGNYTGGMCCLPGPFRKASAMLLWEKHSKMVYKKKANGSSHHSLPSSQQGLMTSLLLSGHLFSAPPYVQRE